MSITKEVTWNGISSITAIPELGIGTVTRRLLGVHRGSFLDIPGRDGANYFSDKRGMRSITMECFVETSDFSAAPPNPRRDAIKAVADWLDHEGQYDLVISDEPGVYYQAVLVEPPDPEEWREFGVFTLEFLAQPYSLAFATTVITYSATVSHNNTFDPALDVYCYPTITITPTNGTITSLTLDVNGYQLSWTGTVASLSSLVINSSIPRISNGVVTDTQVTGAYRDAASAFATMSGAFPILTADANNYVIFNLVAGTATAFTVTISYRKRYRR